MRFPPAELVEEHNKLKPKLAVANFNGGKIKINGDFNANSLSGPENYYASIALPKNKYERAILDDSLSALGILPSDIVLDYDAAGNNLSTIPTDRERLHDIRGEERHNYSHATLYGLTRSAVQKLITAGVKDPVLDAIGEHFGMELPTNHAAKVKS